MTITDRYVDAAQGSSIATNGIRARLRRRGDEVRLTVKRPGVVEDGITERVELDGPATPSLDLHRWPRSAARDVLAEAVRGRPLIEIGRLRQRRITRVVQRGGTRVELSLDGLAAIDGGRVVARRCELEAELLAGDRSALVELAGALGRIDGVGPARGSKLQFALDARAGFSPDR